MSSRLQRFFTRASCAGIFFSFTACDDSPPSEKGQPTESGPVLVSTPLAVRKNSGVSKTLFRALTPLESGINPIVTDDPGHPLAYLISSGMEAGGVAVGDVDGDGLPDLFISSSPGNNRLYRQIGPLKFADITAGSGLEHERVWSRGSSMVDLDDDGDLDIYVANYAEPNHLYLNVGKEADGSIRFEEKAREFGLDLDDASLMPAFCDYDHDGDLDVYLMSNQYHWPDKSKPPSVAQMVGEKDGKPVIKHPYDKFYRVKDYKIGENGSLKLKHDRTGRPNYLMRNDGGKFKDVTLEVGMQPGHGRGLSPTWWDYNDDGHLDLYIANDWADRDFLYHNNGDGTFRDAIEEAVPYTSMFTMGSDTGDLNNDGRIDFFAADMSGTTHYKRKVSMGSMQADQIEFMLKVRPPQNMRNAVYLNTGTSRVLEAAYLMGLANSDWSWTVKIADLDNDGRNDVFITNGMEQNLREIEGTAAGNSGKELRKEKNLAFRNTGNLAFEDVGEAWGLDHFGYSIAAATCDFDRDGDLDIFVMHRDESPVLYENTSSENSVLIQLVGGSSNRQGIGATLKATTSVGTQIRQIILTRGHLTSDEATGHFGLGSDEKIASLEVTWPGGRQQEFHDLASGHLHTISESGEDSPSGVVPPKSLFKEDLDFPVVKHAEREFDDFAVQPLLPNKLSQLGPGMAVGDLDGDGDDDLVLGGAVGSGTQILINKGGEFESPRNLPGTERFEDMGLLLFDADADGDRDLFVVSGGVESSGEDLGDRLYLNDGKGGLSLAPEGALPPDQASGGPVAAADIDRDGDLDLFVGCRVISGQYPLAQESRLLINEGGTFSEQALAGLGMVSGATFSDVDGDGWQDLLVAQEWGPIGYFRNESGKLVDQTGEAGLSELTGWWNGISAADLDGDGDMDFVATNFGFNTKYHASSGHPAVLYYGTFGTDKMRLVEAEFEGEELLPVRGKSCSTNAIPHLAKKFTTFHDFALADMAKIYSKPVIDNSTKFEATTLATGVFLNDGKGRFEFKPLPRLAQIAPGYSPVVCDFDGDGLTDIYLSQNFFSPQPETGRMSGGLGLFLKGTGGGEFQPLGPRESGVSMPDDAKGACLADLDGDSWPDLLIASNNGPLRSFKNQGSGQRIRISLIGPPGNPEAIGARVTAIFQNSSEKVSEIRAGEGYLSQSSSAVFLTRFLAENPSRIKVRWPDGSEATREIEQQTQVIKIRFLD